MKIRANRGKISGSHWLPTLLWMAAIYHFSSRPDPLGLIGIRNQKLALGRIAHFVEYAGLYFWLHYALRQRQAQDQAQKESTWWLALLITFAYAITDELHQGFVPGRDFECSDIMMDMTGALVAMGILKMQKHLVGYNT